MAGGDRRRGWAAALGGPVVALAALTACAGPFQYYEGTGVHDTTAADLAGGWQHAAGAAVLLRQDGTALLTELDGQDFDFDDGWRLSGTGTWQLTDRQGGQVVRLALTARTGVERRSPAPAAAATASPAPPPAAYAWSLHVGRDRQGGVGLFFFTGDPDAGDAYVLTRAVPGP
ncbi:hypothetical protein ABZ747_15460 [Kitasatospora cineracea]|uniref:hypothetical protein n=1 Tax=Kitasatospora cineracea TaxID=88074 RepID=UPI0034069994